MDLSIPGTCSTVVVRAASFYSLSEKERTQRLEQNLFVGLDTSMRCGWATFGYRLVCVPVLFGFFFFK